LAEARPDDLLARYARFEGFDLDGGHPVLHFTNTVDYRGAPRVHDWLRDYLDLLAWCHRTGFLGEQAIAALAARAGAHPRQAAAALGRARELREATAALLHAAIEDRPPEPAPLDVFNAHLGQALARTVLQPGPAAGQPYRLELAPGADPLEEVTLRLARQAGDLLTGFDPARLKICGNPECGWMFLDSTRNASRRWCDMAGCGNRAKARRYYSRKKQEAKS